MTFADDNTGLRDEEIAARSAIAQLLATYNINGDRGRLKELAAVFTPDGILNGRERWCGREGIAQGLARREANRGSAGPGDQRMEFVRHHLTTSLIEFESATRARGRTYFLAVTNVGPDHSGVYVDTYRKQDGAWGIAEREVRIDWVAPGGHTHLTGKRKPADTQTPSA